MPRGGARRKEAKSKGRKAFVKAVEANEAGSSSTTIKEPEVKGADKNVDTRIIDPVLAEDIPDRDLRFAGEVLVEISEVAIRIWQDTDCYFHGKVSVGFGNRLFHRPKETPVKFPYFGGQLTLTGPQHALQGVDRLVFEVDLWEGERQLIKGFPDWIGLYTLEGHQKLDRLSRIEIRGRDNALAEINYVVYSNAVVATVEMKLNKHSTKNGMQDHDFYGSIYAMNSKIPRIASRIFYKEEDDPIQVRHGDVIPLARSVIAVPLGAYLEFEAHVPLLSSDGMACEFSARKVRGVSVGELTGEYGQLEVSVTWETFYDHYTRLGIYK